jgi:hypothetical protein
MKRFLLAALLSLASIFPAAAQEYYDIDVDLPQYPEMAPVEDSPVYYAPGVDSNYFFYDGLYWDFYNDGWYSSPWYNGPWSFVDPIYVPTYILWVPIRYYRKPSHYWHGWNAHRPPRWGERWGRDWQARHNQVFAGRERPRYGRAPLPDYQRSYNRANYPRVPQQQSQLHTERYGYRPQEHTVQQQYQRRGIGAPPAPQVQQAPQRTESAPANPTARAERREESRGDGRRDGGGRDRR